MICIPITAAANNDALRAIKKSCLVADCIELRMDLIGDGNLRQLISAARKSSPSVTIIVTCRKKDEHVSARKKKGNGSVGEKTKTQKIALLKEAIKLGADFIDIELAEGSEMIRKLKYACAKQGGKTEIIVSHHNIETTPAVTKLKEIFHRCAKLEPAVVKIVTYAKNVEDNLKVLGLIPYARKHSQKIIALCMGDKGRISRIAAPGLGNFLSFAALEAEGQSAPGQLTVDEMKLIDNMLKSEKHILSPPLLFSNKPRNYVLLGNPVGHSLSPLMHNAALKEMGIEESYSAFCVQNLSDAVRGIRGMNIRGASITIPFKVSVMEYLDAIDKDALEAGSVNTIINDNGRLTGSNTDWQGLVLTLKEKMTIKGKAFVILGAGGTARAAIYGILKEGGFPIIINRTEQKGKMLSEIFGCPFYPPSEIGNIKADCLINTTPVGMFPHEDKSPVQKEALKSYKYVMDVIYNPLKTKLLKEAQQQGCQILPGLDMFISQGAQQIFLWTGKNPSRELMKKVVLEELTNIE